ncbi:hypothetical protein Poly30_13700 [Planctomycetes bacterium Poly30]|uniref:Uncharacterized protein n=1 Tax=Saltatorellus ferox TaxID=2528018 RepID=A0A518EP45_9BACT|nr:hypothetical protein Poly30_13700 [Planctomycetes bacterium Poly30]
MRKIQTPLLLALALASQGCGGSSSDSQDPPGGAGELTVSTGALVDGAAWQLNRPIEITLDRPVNFASVNLGSVVVQTVQNATPVNGTYSLGVDPVTGEEDGNMIRFQPHCPAHAGEVAGFEPGTDYELLIHGSDSYFPPLRARDGTVLENTLEVTFRTLAGSDPALIFYDPVAGPPSVVFRGRGGVPLTDSHSTRFELGSYQPSRVEMRADGLGGLQVDSGSIPLVPFGLPLNHYIAPTNQVALVVEFDQPVLLSRENLELLELQYFDLTWKTIPCQVEGLIGCGLRGSAVRLRPLGTLPPGLDLRLSIGSGFRDLVGQLDFSDRFEALPITGTTEQSPIGARVDALYESFAVGGSEPGSMEDVMSDLGAPRGYWDRGYISGVETPDGISRVRSKWHPVGLAGVQGGSTSVRPSFSLSGTDAEGVVRAAGGEVILDPTIIGPVPPAAMQEFAVELGPMQIMDPMGLRSAQPALLLGDRAILRQSPTTSAPSQSQIFGVDASGVHAILYMGYGCYAPGFSLDCVPWDLASSFPTGSGATVEITPQSFEVYTWIHRDSHHPDHRVTITFDAAPRLPNGQPDETMTYSATNGWTGDVTQFSGGDWGFIRFEVQFELDVSGDGYQALERSPVLDFLKVPIDFR